MTKLEEVARAICLKVQLQDFGHDADEGFLTTAKKVDALDAACLEAARAAIKALMEHQPPTVCMVSETYDYNIGPQDAQSIWQGWLQTILDEESETV